MRKRSNYIDGKEFKEAPRGSLLGTANQRGKRDNTGFFAASSVVMFIWPIQLNESLCLANRRPVQFAPVGREILS
jgi:hypothetical protein